MNNEIQLFLKSNMQISYFKEQALSWPRYKTHAVKLNDKIEFI